MTLTIDFCGELYEPSRSEPFYIGRDGDLTLDDNRFLHRRFLRIRAHESLWSLANVGDRLSATVADAEGFSQSWLAPGAEVPIVFARTVVRFTAGQTAYEIDLVLSDPIFTGHHHELAGTGSTTRGTLNFTESQFLLVLALAEPVIRSGRGVSAIPSSAEAARRLGWTLTRFNRKLDNVCERLGSIGVRGLHGASGSLATSRRARLVEYAISVRLVTVDDLSLIDQARESGGSAARRSLENGEGEDDGG